MFLKVLFIFLASANILDAILTYIGINLSVIQEGNPVMAFVYSIEPLLFLVIKIILSAILIGMILFKLVPSHVFVKGITIAATIGYSFVILLHGNWLFTLL